MENNLDCVGRDRYNLMLKVIKFVPLFQLGPNHRKVGMGGTGTPDKQIRQVKLLS